MRRESGQALLGVGVLIAFSLSFGHTPNRNGALGSKGEVRVAYFPNLTHAPVLIAVRDHFYEEEIPGFKVSSFVVNAGPEAMEALVAGRIDVACVGPSPALNTFLRTHGKALRIIAGVCSGGASLLAREGSGIASVAELDGKRVADPDIGGTQDVSLRHFLSSNGLAPREQGGTVEIVPLKNADILTAIKRSQIDAAWVPEPWASRIRLEAGARRVVDERELWPGGRFTTAILVARTDFMQRHPNVIAGIVRGNRRAVALLNREPSRAKKEANAELAQLNGKPLSESVLTEAWPRLVFSSDLDRTSLYAFSSAARDAGYLRSKQVDLSSIYAESEATGPVVRAR